MLPILAVVLPIFALILAGYACGRWRVLGPHATGELNRFVVQLALPAQLFAIVAHARPAELWQPGFIGAFGGAAALVFAGTIAWRRAVGRAHVADATIEALNAGYANTGFLGLPLAAATIGPAAVAPTMIATILTACVLFAVAIVLIEWGLRAGGAHPAGAIARSLVRNPLLVAPVAGALPALLGVALPGPVDRFAVLLAGASSPCALVTIGLFLATERRGEGAGRGALAAALGLKLLVQPALTWVLASFVFRLPALLTHVAVLLAALPTGTGPFMIAERYGREAGLTSRAILLSTVLSLPTVTAYLATAR